MQLASIAVSVKAKIKFDTREQVRKFKQFIEPYHKQALEAAADAMRDAIVEKGAYTSGNLFESVSTKLFTRNTDALEGSVFFDKTASDYAFFVDQGRKSGKFPPIEKIKAWIGNFSGFTEGSEYAVAAKIAASGTKGKKFYALGKRKAMAAYRNTVKEGLKQYKGTR